MSIEEYGKKNWAVRTEDKKTHAVELRAIGCRWNNKLKSTADSGPDPTITTGWTCPIDKKEELLKIIIRHEAGDCVVGPPTSTLTAAAVTDTDAATADAPVVAVEQPLPAVPSVLSVPSVPSVKVGVEPPSVVVAKKKFHREASEVFSDDDVSSVASLLQEENDDDDDDQRSQKSASSAGSPLQKRASCTISDFENNCTLQRLPSIGSSCDDSDNAEADSDLEEDTQQRNRRHFSPTIDEELQIKRRRLRKLDVLSRYHHHATPAI